MLKYPQNDEATPVNGTGCFQNDRKVCGSAVHDFVLTKKKYCYMVVLSAVYATNSEFDQTLMNPFVVSRFGLFTALRSSFPV